MLGSGTANSNSNSGRPANSNAPTTGRPGPSSARPDPRAAAAEAAERRLKAVSTPHRDCASSSSIQKLFQEQKRGTNSANPNRGKLANQLAKQNSQKPTHQTPEDDRLVVSLRLLLLSTSQSLIIYRSNSGIRTSHPHTVYSGQRPSTVRPYHIF